jgi:hypothetical protein
MKMLKRFVAYQVIILATLRPSFPAELNEVALIIGGVKNIGGGDNEILEVEVYAPFSNGFSAEVPDLPQHLSYVKAIYYENEDTGLGEVLACGKLDPNDKNMKCFQLTIVDEKLQWLDNFKHQIPTKYCSLINRYKTDSFLTYCYQTEKKKGRGKAFKYFNRNTNWDPDSTIDKFYPLINSN